MYFTVPSVDKRQLKFESLAADFKSKYGFLFDDPDRIIYAYGVRPRRGVSWSAIHQPASSYAKNILGRHIAITKDVNEERMKKSQTVRFPVTDTPHGVGLDVRRFEVEAWSRAEGGERSTEQPDAQKRLRLGIGLLDEMISESPVLLPDPNF